MQVLALTLMEPPTGMDATRIRDEKVKLLRAVEIPEPRRGGRSAVRGQYTAGVIDGEPVPGYREEEDVDPHSPTETYVALSLGRQLALGRRARSTSAPASACRPG